MRSSDIPFRDVVAATGQNPILYISTFDCGSIVLLGKPAEFCSYCVSDLNASEFGGQSL